MCPLGTAAGTRRCSALKQGHPAGDAVDNEHRDGAARHAACPDALLTALLIIVAYRVCRDFLLESLRATANETTQHGAALGLGIAGLGSQDEEVFEDLKAVLYTDSAIAGEVHA